MRNNYNENQNKSKTGGIWGTIIVSIIAIVMAVIFFAWATNGWQDINPEKWFNSWGMEQTPPNDPPDDSEPDTPHVHTFDTTKWVSDGKNHWHAATCGHDIVRDLTAHTLKNDICTVCGYEKQTEPEQHTHTYDTTKWVSDGVNHWHAATCGHTIIRDTAAHTFVNNTCTVCGYEKQTESEPHKHTYNTSKWVGDEVNHWHASTCGHDIVKDMSAHTFENDVCTVCGYVKLAEGEYKITYETLGNAAVSSITVNCPVKAKVGESVTVTLRIASTGTRVKATRAVLQDLDTGKHLSDLELTSYKAATAGTLEAVSNYKTEFKMPDHNVTVIFYYGN